MFALNGLKLPLGAFGYCLNSVCVGSGCCLLFFILSPHEDPGIVGSFYFHQVLVRVSAFQISLSPQPCLSNFTKSWLAFPISPSPLLCLKLILFAPSPGPGFYSSNFTKSCLSTPVGAALPLRFHQVLCSASQISPSPMLCLSNFTKSSALLLKFHQVLPQHPCRSCSASLISFSAFQTPPSPALAPL